MNSNRDLLKEAIADAKAVKETAIANAKAALEESFGPFLREKLAAKLSEMDEMEETYEMEEGEEKMEEGYDDLEERLGTLNDPSEEGVGNAHSMSPKGNLEEEDLEELDLEELLRELDEETINEAEDKEEDNKEESSEEEISIEDMSEEDLKKFIEDVISDMIEAGELEAGEGMEDDEEMSGEEDTEVDLEELMFEIKQAKAKKAKTGIAKTGKAKEETEELKGKLKEAYSTIEEMKKTLNEINLLNAKLLYTNKIFKSKSLTESQKVKVLAAFDKATSKKEAQLVYETLLEGFQQKKSSITESRLSSASRVLAGPAAKQPIIEVDNQFARWQKLAGIKK